MKTVKLDVLREVMQNWPVVPIHKIHRASKKHPFSGTQRLRELRKNGVLEYEYDLKNKSYLILTPIKMIKAEYFRMQEVKKSA